MGGWRFFGDTDAEKYDPTLTTRERGKLEEALAAGLTARAWLPYYITDK